MSAGWRCQSGSTRTRKRQVHLPSEPRLELGAGFLAGDVEHRASRPDHDPLLRIALNHDIGLDDEAIRSLLDAPRDHDQGVGQFLSEPVEELLPTTSATRMCSAWSVVISLGKNIGPSSRRLTISARSTPTPSPRSALTGT